MDARFPSDMDARFPAGSHVEVIGCDEGLVGSYHTAIVLSHKAELGFVRVRYEELQDQNGDVLDELRPSNLLRPLPPNPYQNHGYKKEAHVDLFNRCGWWYGIIRGRRGPGKYLVDFSGFGYDNMVCDVANLRPHLHWDGTTFVTPPRLNFIR